MADRRHAAPLNRPCLATRKPVRAERRLAGFFVSGPPPSPDRHVRRNPLIWRTEKGRASGLWIRRSVVQAHPTVPAFYSWLVNRLARFCCFVLSDSLRYATRRYKTAFTGISVLRRYLPPPRHRHENHFPFSLAQSVQRHSTAPKDGPRPSILWEEFIGQIGLLKGHAGSLWNI